MNLKATHKNVAASSHANTVFFDSHFRNFLLASHMPMFELTTTLLHNLMCLKKLVQQKSKMCRRKVQVQRPSPSMPGRHCTVNCILASWKTVKAELHAQNTSAIITLCYTKMFTETLTNKMKRTINLCPIPKLTFSKHETMRSCNRGTLLSPWLLSFLPPIKHI